MALSHKDINLLTQKATIAGTEKIPVSDTEYVTTNQIAGLAHIPTLSTSVADDATDDTKTSTPHSVKSYVDGVVGDIESLLASI